MGCGCQGSNSNQAMVYRYTSAGGQVTNYRTEIEARAAVVRAGGTGTVTPVQK